MAKEQGKEFMNIQMEIFMKENGAQIWNKAREDCKWQQETSIKANGSKEKKMVQGSMYLPMEMYIKVNLRMEIDKDKGLILGLIKVIIKDNGLLTRWMEKDCTQTQKYN